MPTESIIVIVGITSAFVIFALVLAWADFQTTRTRKQRTRQPAE
jgi:hypothetical protein